MRVVDQCARHLGSLSHSLRVRADGAIRGILEPHALDRDPGSGVGVAHALEPGVEADVFEAGQETVDRFALGNQPDPAVDGRIPAWAETKYADGAGRRRQEAGQHVEQGRLARSVRPEEPSDSRPEAERDVVDGNHVPIPPGRVDELDHRGLRGRDSHAAILL